MTDGNGVRVLVNRADDYTYLGTHVVNLEGQVKRRIGMAWNSIRKFRAFWDSKCPYNVKRQLFICLVQSGLTYGMEILPDHLVDLLDAAYGRMLNYVFRRGKKDLDEWEKYNNGAFPHLSSVLKFRRVKLIGHSLRHDEPLARILQTPHIMCFRRNKDSDMSKVDGRTPSVIKSIAADLSFYYRQGEKFLVKHAQPSSQWPKPFDRDGWRKLANEVAAAHEDELYAPLVKSRVERWDAPCHDPAVLDGLIRDKQKLKNDIGVIRSGAIVQDSELDLYLCHCSDPKHVRQRSVHGCKKCFDDYVGMSYVRLRVNQFQETLERNHRHDDAVPPTAHPPARPQPPVFVRFRDLEYDAM